MGMLLAIVQESTIVALTNYLIFLDTLIYVLTELAAFSIADFAPS